MSCYIKPTIHPKTGKIEQAEWIDNYFGHHVYGVRFPSDKKIYHEDQVSVDTKIQIC